MVSPARRRDAAAYLVRKFRVSERRACRLLDQHRSTQRYRPVTSEEEQQLIKAMAALAEQHPRWGYRAITKLLRDDGWPVNAKRIERLWRLEGHHIPPSKLPGRGQKARGMDENSTKNRPAVAANHIWSYDFISARVRRGGSIRILNVVDEFTRISLGSHVARSIGARSIVAHLDRLFELHGRPSAIRSDNGREFIASTVVDWLNERGVEAVFIAKGSPQQNAFVERFNGTMRRDLLNVEEFANLTEARVLVDNWNREYNEQRPHRGLKMMTPLAYARAHAVVGR
jgi:putative transposase